jgi:Transmembrane secretion effector
MRRLFTDVTPLRDGVFRRFWVSGMLSSVGNQMTNFAVMLQVYRLTHSSFDVGIVGLSAAVPAICIGLFGGVVIDAFDRRRLVLATSTALVFISLLFTVQAAAGSRALWLLYLLTAIEAASTAINNPARTTVTVSLLPGERLQSGMALASLAFRGSYIFGPALAGLLVAANGLTLCYLIDSFSFVVALYGVVGLPAMPPPAGPTGPSVAAVVAGLSVVRRSRVLMGALLADLNATFLAMPVALFPAINAARFGGSPRTLGLLSTALAVGGVVGSALSGPLAHIRSQGKGMLVGGAAWGAAIAGFGLAHGLVLALVFLALAGAADVASVVMRTTIIQFATPAAYLGRVNATDYAVGSGFPQLGNFRAGIMGSLTSPSTSAAIGGVASMIGTGVIALALPALVRYRGRPMMTDGTRPQMAI